jgi:integrase
VRADPKNVDSPLLPCLSIVLGRTKTGQADDDRRVLLLGRPVEALKNWLERADITNGAIFRSIDRWDAVGERALAPQSVNLIVKHRARLAGLDPRELSAHGLRSGYLTEAARRGVALPEAMQQSQHKSVQQAASYYNEAEQRLGRAVRVIV